MWPGTYTKQGQAAWSVAGNSQYVVYGGEFPTVNTTAQQGLVRFAIPSLAPNLVRPTTSAGLTPTATSTVAGQATITWTATGDRDNGQLTYKVYRDYEVITGAPVCVVTDGSLFWAPKALSCVDTSAPPGATVNYRVIAFDPYLNRNTGNAVTVSIVGPTATTTPPRTGLTPVARRIPPVPAAPTPTATPTVTATPTATPTTSVVPAG